MSQLPATHKSSDPTSNAQPSPISILNDDVLLHIFYLYRPLIGDEENDSEDIPFVRRWDRQRWWYKVAQVCRCWRYIILASPSLLDLNLLCTYGVPVMEMLEHSPPLPLTIFYNNGDREMTAEDEEGTLLALQQRDRVRRIALEMPTTKLKKFTLAMDEGFPVLESIYIRSQSEENTSLILPRTFQAPNLRHLLLWYAALPMQSPVLTPTAGLVFLWLGGIPQSAYSPPNDILRRLSLMPQLETLGIGFHTPLSKRKVTSVNPTMTHVTLPHLRVFSFQGVSAYLEGLLSWIDAPSLRTLEILFSNQLIFDVPRLFHFMGTSENLTFNALELAFDMYFVDLKADPLWDGWRNPLRLRIMCRHLDWQVASVVQILDSFSPILSAVEKLTLSHVEHNRSSEWHNDVDRTQWHDLLKPFEGVKTLQVPKELVGGLAHSLRSENKESSPGLLPNLEVLRFFGGSRIGDAFVPFIDERKAVGHTVHLAGVGWPSSQP
jgi:hypothetical protein